MKRGFYTGLAAALAFFALSVLWLLTASQSDRQVSDLVQLQALQVSERAQDAVPYLLSAVADAQSDSAFAAHGCAPAPGTSFCTDLQARLPGYLADASGTLSVPPVAVDGFVSGFACQKAANATVGFLAAYSVNGTLNITLSGGPVKAVRSVNFSDTVSVNESGPSNPFRALVNRTGVGTVWDESTRCS